MGTGLIYAAIVAAWAAYLVPLWLRRQDDAVAAREEGSTIAGRVVRSRRTSAPAEAAAPGSAGPAAAVLESAGSGSADDVVAAEPEPLEEEEFVPVAYEPTSAARRRRTLLVLLLATTATAVVAALGYAPWWTVAVPGGAVPAFIAVSAVAAGHERKRRRAPVRAVRDTDSKVDHQPAPSAAEPTADTRTEPARRVPRDDGLWDPVSVPLPTYVTKAKAPRTVRTISLSDPDTWTSGRLREPEPEPAADPAKLPELDADAATGTDGATPRGR